MIADPRVSVLGCSRADIDREWIDRRTLLSLEYLADSGLDPQIVLSRCGKSSTRAELVAVNGEPVADAQGATASGALALARITAMPTGSAPATRASTGSSGVPAGIVLRATSSTTATSSGAGRSTATAASAASTSTRTGAAASSTLLTTAQWRALGSRLDVLGNPPLLRNPAVLPDH